MAITIVDADFVAARIGEIPILDVRTPDEFVEGHVPSALNVPVQRVGPGTAFIEYVEGLIPDKGQPLIVYCLKGIRSAHAAELLNEAGYETIFDYSGSWLDWSGDSSRPVAK